MVSVGNHGGKTKVEAAVVASCDSFQVRAVGEVEFDWRTPRAPEEYTEPYLPHLGVRLRAVEVSAGVVRAFHYDGFTLREFDLDVENNTVLQHNVEL
jgi:hypothetical protein